MEREDDDGHDGDRDDGHRAASLKTDSEPANEETSHARARVKPAPR